MSNAIGMDAVKAGGMSETGRPAIVVQDGTIEALKWLGVVLMTLDHINKYFFNETLPGVFELGRLTMPIFGFVLAYNLARPGCLAKGAYGRTMKRMALYGLLATPFYMILGAGQLVFGWFPLNIMAMLFVATASLYLVELGGRRAILAAEVVFLLGILVDWPGRCNDGMVVFPKRPTYRACQRNRGYRVVVCHQP